MHKSEREYFDRKCKNCDCTFGSHHGGSSPYPRDYCPGHEGRMDWENGPGTIFEHDKGLDTNLKPN